MRKTLIALGLTLMTAGIAFAEERQVRIEVSGLWCPSCSYIAGEALQKSVSVEIVEFEEYESGESGVYTITFDDALANIDEIVAQPAAYGYSAVLLEDASLILSLVMKDKLLLTGVVGTAIAALCCFTPVLVVLLGVVGLSALTGVLDYILIPSLVFFVLLTIYALVRRARSQQGDFDV